MRFPILPLWALLDTFPPWAPACVLFMRFFQAQNCDSFPKTYKLLVPLMDATHQSSDR
jgi:hypothetical protein